MFGTRIKVGLASMGIVATGLAAAMTSAPAHAAGVSAAVFQANTQAIIPPVPVVGAGCGIALGGPWGVQGTCPGTYRFAAGPATGNGGQCVGVSLPAGAAGNCNISSQSGNYTNIQCGTGTAADATATVTDSLGTVHATPYNIIFVAGIGVILGPGVVGVPATAGVVQITPTNGGNCVTAPVATFTATGVAVTTN